MNTELKLDREMARLAEGEAALANRATWSSMLAALLAIIAMVSIPVTFRETDRADFRALSAAPLAGAAGAAVRAYAARRGLETVRSRKAELLSDAESAPGGGAETPKAS